jgi:hypothetical protein
MKNKIQQELEKMGITLQNKGLGKVILNSATTVEEAFDKTQSAVSEAFNEGLRSFQDLGKNTETKVNVEKKLTEYYSKKKLIFNGPLKAFKPAFNAWWFFLTDTPTVMGKSPEQMIQIGGEDVIKKITQFAMEKPAVAEAILAM